MTMGLGKRLLAFGGATAIGLGAAVSPMHAASARAGGAGPAVEKNLVLFLERYLPFDPATKVTVARAPERLPGFQGYKGRRTGKYEKLNVERTVYVSTDGKWFFAGEAMKHTEGKPPAAGDLSWIERSLNQLYRSKVRATRAPERDAAGWKGVAVAVETGFGPVRMPGYVTADGKTFLHGPLWNFREDPRMERRRKIDLAGGPVEGKTDASVTIVEYADMECGYCKYRGTQLDRLLEANKDVLPVRHHYKFFPLWFGHAWAMKAASAGDCLLRLGSAPAFFRFKSIVYSRQEGLSVTGIDELAVTSAEALGVAPADFLSCYLQEESFGRVRKDMEEGQRMEVNSTPTYFVDGTEISWIEDTVMEDFLRTKAPNLKGIKYGPN
ncbi:MAG: DsbA family protein [Thermoanaerobaculia bacterium]